MTNHPLPFPKIPTTTISDTVAAKESPFFAFYSPSLSLHPTTSSNQFRHGPPPKKPWTTTQKPKLGSKNKGIGRNGEQQSNESRGTQFAEITIITSPTSRGKGQREDRDDKGEREEKIEKRESRKREMNKI